MTRIPTDSADARELREMGGDHDDLARPHLCRRGWLGDEDHPKPCPTCRPHLAPCASCGASRGSCAADRRDSGHRCCPGCTHTAASASEVADSANRRKSA